VVRKYSIAKGEIIEKWAKNYPNVMLWSGKYPNEDVRIRNTQMLWIFCDWAKVTPDELLALKDDISSHEAERLLDKFVADQTTEIPNSVKWNVVSCVKAFFAAHYRDLARKSGAMSLEKVKPYRKPTKEGLRKLWDVCYNPRDRSMVVSMPNSTGIALDSIHLMKWKHIEEGWENIDTPHISLPPELVKGHGKGKYRDVRQETFLTPEAKEDLSKYKRWMENVKGVTFTQEMNVYLTTEKPFKPLTYKALGKVVSNVAKRAGVPYSLHDARRYVQTALEEARLPANWARKIRGRKIRGEENPYSRPEIEKLREAFKEAIPFLMFKTEAPPRVRPEDLRRALLEEVPDEKLKPLADKFGMTISDARRMLIREKKVFDKWQEEIREKKPKKTALTGGTDCQRIVTEEELEGYLASGWRVCAVLPSGRVVISNE